MKNIYAIDFDKDEHLKKNVNDLSHRENLTMDFGKIYPLGQPIEVVPGDTIDLSLSAAIHAMPLIFPVQTPMQFKIFVFFVPNRITWNDKEDSWENYITGVYDNTSKKPVHPTHKINTQAMFDKMLTTGSILDYLGVPTTSAGSFGASETLTLERKNIDSIIHNYPTQITGDGIIPSDKPDTTQYTLQALSAFPSITDQYRIKAYIFNPVPYEPLLSHQNGYYDNSTLSLVPDAQRRFELLFQEGISERLFAEFSQGGLDYSSLAFVYPPTDKPVVKVNGNLILNFPNSIDTASSYMSNMYGENSQICLLKETAKFSNQYELYYFHENSLSSVDHTGSSIRLILDSNTSTHDIVSIINDNIVSQGLRYRFVLLTWASILTTFSDHEFVDVTVNPVLRCFIGDQLSFLTTASQISDVTPSHNPFYGNNPIIPLSALPARAYESCCRSYFLNDKIAPLLDANNEPIYNDYNRNHSGGQDNLTYDFFQANYELDQFTDAVPSPQFGDAPLIGITITSGNTATLNFSADSIVGTSPQSTGGTLSADVTFTDDDNMQVTGITKLSHEMPSGNLRDLMQMVNYGISINDIRNVNSYTRYLERMQRRTYKYKDQIRNHFGEKVSNVDLQMPVYLGGYNMDVVVNKVNNTSAPSLEGDAPLGDYAGQASIFDKMKHQIKHHCSEHGLIICLGYIVPRPCYTQTLPKIFTKTEDKLDYFTPEFGHIGYVPIHNYELAPIQFRRNDIDNNTDTIHGVFGYQKAWYEYFNMIDGAHGQFRTSLADYLAMRLFNEAPQLNKRFINVYAEDINNIFTIQDTDPFVGFVDYKCHISRPIPRPTAPRLE